MAASHIFEFRVTDRPQDWLTVIAPGCTLERVTADLREQFRERLIAVRPSGQPAAPIDPRGVIETSGPGSPPGPAPSLNRHRWERLERHRYRCRKCGMTRINYVHPDTHEWQSAFALPGQRPAHATKVPPCPTGLAIDLGAAA